MSTFSALSAVLVIGLITYLSRAGLILFLAGRELSSTVVRALQNVGPAVMSALVVSILAGDEGMDGLDLPELAAISLAVFVGWKTRNLILTLVVGMLTLWLVAALLTNV